MTPPGARVVAQAKVNLMLHVLAREASGYHQLETIFQRLELGDEVTVRIGTGTRAVSCRGADCGPPERNLAYRAAIAYAEATGWPSGFDIEIVKRVPVGGGLGGGSADAGAVLRALDALAPRPIGEPRLLQIAASLGSDVPFLTTTAPLALAWGRGERMLALEPLPRRRVVLGLFERGVATGDAYGWLASARMDAPPARLLPTDDLSSWGAIAAHAANDFESVVLPRRPDIADVLARLGAASPLIARMSGSGATVFAILEDGAASPDPGDVADAHGSRPLSTWTAENVVPVEVIE